MARFLTFLVSTLFLISFVYSKSYAACSIKTLKQVCDVCEERAINKLDIDSVCPPQTCPEINCPAISKSCIQVDSFTHFLKPSYTISTKLGESDFLFRINFSKNEDKTGVLQYDVRASNFRMLIDNAIGFLIYDIVNFNLPVIFGEALLSYNCIGVIDSESVIRGNCSTLSNNGEEKPVTYRWNFTAIPE